MVFNDSSQLADVIEIVTTKSFEKWATEGRGKQVQKTSRRIADATVLLATVIVAAVSIFGGSANAAEAGSHHPMRFDRISLDEGLSQSNVFAILQDSEGLMWFGTENGLNQYNGYEFTVFKRERGNPDALFNDYIFDLAEDRYGQIWVASNGGGLARFNRSAGTFRTYRSNDLDATTISSNSIRKLLADADGSVWLGTRDSGVDRFDPRNGTARNFQFGEVEDLIDEFE